MQTQCIHMAAGPVSISSLFEPILLLSLLKPCAFRSPDRCDSCNQVPPTVYFADKDTSYGSEKKTEVGISKPETMCNICKGQQSAHTVGLKEIQGHRKTRNQALSYDK